MTDEQLVAGQHAPTHAWYKNRLVLFIAGSIVLAFVLVTVSMMLYISSGTVQLDASRPGVKAVQNKVDQSDTFKGFPATGSVTSSTLDEFKKLYDEQVRQVTSIDAFDPTVLGDQSLGIDAPGADQ